MGARVMSGEWDSAPNLQAFIPQAEADLIRNREEVESD
jgi:hypothetical protein